MKKPSKLMPKYTQKKETYSFWSWIFLILIISSIGYIIWDKPYALLLFIPYFIISYFSSKKLEKKLQKLAQERVGLDIGSFAKSFDYKNVDTWVIRAVYEQLQEYIGIENFPIIADDDLWKDLEIDDDDFHYDILEEISQRTGRTLDNMEQNPYYTTGSTVKNIVLFFNEQKMSKDNKTE